MKIIILQTGKPMNEFNTKLDGGEERMGEPEDRSDKLFRLA